MKANEFVKKFGWGNMIDESKICGIDKSVVDIEELKRLVESYKIVNFYGGIQNAKEIVKISARSGYRPSSLSDINQAIADV